MQRRLFMAGLVGMAASPRLTFARGAVLPASAMAEILETPRDAQGLYMSGEDGARLSISDYAGALVVLNLWGPWCQPCRREMPSLSRLAGKVDPARIKVVPLAFDWRGPVWVQKFYDEVAITNLPIVMGDGQNLLNTLGLEKLPSTAIIDKTGHHIATVEGEALWDDDASIAWLKTLAA